MILEENKRMLVYVRFNKYKWTRRRGLIKSKTNITTNESFFIIKSLPFNEFNFKYIL